MVLFSKIHFSSSDLFKFFHILQTFHCGRLIDKEERFQRRLVQVKSASKVTVYDCCLWTDIHPCVDADHPPSSCTPCLSWHRSCMCVGFGGIFWILQEKHVALHATVSHSLCPKQSVAGRVSACASQTRLNNLPPLCS